MPTMLEQSQAGAAQQTPVQTGTFGSSPLAVTATSSDRAGQWTTLSTWLREHPGATVADAQSYFNGLRNAPGGGGANTTYIDPRYVHFTLTIGGENQAPTLDSLFRLPFTLSRAQLIELQQKLFQAGYYGDAYKNNSQPTYGDPNDPRLALALQAAATSALREGTTMDAAITHDAAQFASDIANVNSNNAAQAGAVDMTNWTQEAHLTNPDDIEQLGDQIAQKVFGRKMTDAESLKMIQVVQDQQRLSGQQSADLQYHNAFDKGLLGVSQSQIAAGATPATGASPTGGLVNPLQNMNWGKGALGFGYNRGSHTHAGNDIDVPVGTTIVAPTSGTIEQRYDASGYGNELILHGDDGRTYIFGHVEDQGLKMAPTGTKVTPGQPIGLSGGAKGAHGSGDSTGPHVHFEVHGPDGRPVDPVPLFAGAGAASMPKSTSTNPQGYTRPGQRNADQTDQGGNPLGVYDAHSAQQAPGGIVGPSSPSPSSSAPSGSAVDANGRINFSQWAADVLTGMGIIPNAENVLALVTWASKENGNNGNSAKYNVLNTHLKMPGSWTAIRTGEQGYTSYAQGVQAAVQTIEEPRYFAIVNALRSGTAEDAVKAIMNSPWATSHEPGMLDLLNQVRAHGVSVPSGSGVSVAGAGPTGSAGPLGNLGDAMTQPTADPNANVQFNTDAASVSASIEAELRRDNPALAGAHDLASSYDAFTQLLSGGTPSVV